MNPYESPMSGSPAAPMSEAEAIRLEHIGHEASVKGVGLLLLIKGILFAFYGFAGTIVSVVFKPTTYGLMPVELFFYLALGVLYIFVGWHLRILNMWARVVMIVLSAIGLLLSLGAIFVSPHWIGAILLVSNAYVIHLMIVEKGQLIFSQEYRHVVLVTPLIHSYSKGFWIFLTLNLMYFGSVFFV